MAPQSMGMLTAYGCIYIDAHICVSVWVCPLAPQSKFDVCLQKYINTHYQGVRVCSMAPQGMSAPNVYLLYEMSSQSVGTNPANLFWMGICVNTYIGTYV